MVSTPPVFRDRTLSTQFLCPFRIVLFCACFVSLGVLDRPRRLLSNKKLFLSSLIVRFVVIHDVNLLVRLEVSCRHSHRRLVFHAEEWLRLQILIRLIPLLSIGCFRTILTLLAHVCYHFRFLLFWILIVSMQVTVLSSVTLRLHDPVRSRGSFGT